MHQHRLNYRAKLGACPATNTPFSNYYLPMLQERTIKCPSGYALIYSAGPPAIGTLLREKPWAVADPGKCPGCKGGVTKGNPIEIVSGNKRQRESDYRASGASPLGFSRYFNSWLASAIGTTAASASGALPATRIGLAWTADYFQSIQYYDEGAVASAFVFRPDGERFPFNESGGVFQPSADVDFTLTAQRDLAERLPAGRSKAEAMSPRPMMAMAICCPSLSAMASRKPCSIRMDFLSRSPIRSAISFNSTSPAPS